MRKPAELSDDELEILICILLGKIREIESEIVKEDDDNKLIALVASLDRYNRQLFDSQVEEAKRTYTKLTDGELEDMIEKLENRIDTTRDLLSDASDSTTASVLRGKLEDFSSQFNQCKSELFRRQSVS